MQRVLWELKSSHSMQTPPRSPQLSPRPDPSTRITSSSPRLVPSTSLAPSTSLPPDARATPPLHTKIKSALDYYRKLTADKTSWTTPQTLRDIRISTYKMQPAGRTSPLPIVRGEYTFPDTPNRDAFIRDLVDIVQSDTARQTWDARYESSKVLSYLSHSLAKVHARMKGLFPVAPRDCVLLHGRVETLVSTYIVQTGVDADPVRGYVRAGMAVVCWEFERLDDQGVRVTFLADTDPCGYIYICVHLEFLIIAGLFPTGF